MNDLSKIFVGLVLLCSILSAGADVKVFVTNQGSNSVTVFSFDGKFELLREIQVGKAPAGVALSTVNRFWRLRAFNYYLQTRSCKTHSDS